MEPAAGVGTIARTEPTSRCCSGARGAGPARPVVGDAPLRASLGRCARLRIAWSRDLGGLPVDPAVTAVLEAAERDSGGLGCVVEDAEPSFEGADECFEVLRGLTFAGAFKEILHQVKPTLAENVRFGLALTPERIARALELRGELFTRMRAFLVHYDALAAPVTQVPAVRRRARVPDRDRGRADGLLPRVVPLVLADHGHGASGGRGAGGVHARGAADRAAARGAPSRRGRAAAARAGVHEATGLTERRPPL